MKYLISLILFSVSFSAMAIRTAVVNTEKTIVYSDMTLDSPIGYIRGGKTLKVGKKARMKGTIVPIIVSGRVAYVQTKDLRFVEDDDQIYSPKITEHNIDNEQFKVLDPLSDNNHIVFQLGQFSMGNNWDTISEEAGDRSSSALTSYNIMLEHRSPIKSIGFGVGGTYYAASQENVQIQALSVDGQIYWSPLKFSWFSVDLLLGGMLSFDTRVKVTQVEGASKGSFYGWHIGPQARIFPEKKIGFTVGFGYKRIVVSGLKKIITQTNQELPLDLMSGVHGYGGISYRF